MSLYEILKHGVICAVATVGASAASDKLLNRSSMSTEDKRAVKNTVTGAAAGASLGYMVGEIANKGHKGYTLKEKLVSSAVGGVAFGAAAYCISRVVEYNGKKLAAESASDDDEGGGGSDDSSGADGRGSSGGYPSYFRIK